MWLIIFFFNILLSFWFWRVIFLIGTFSSFANLSKSDLISHIYAFSEKKIILVNDINFSENFLIYIDKIQNVTIKKNSDEYQKYLELSKIMLTDELYNTYDNYIKKRYKIDINYQALDIVKNYFN